MAENPLANVRIGAMLVRVVVPIVGVAAVGVWPTYQRAGSAGLWAELTAGLIVLATAIASAAAVKKLGSSGPQAAPYVLVYARMGRVIGCVLVTVAVGWAMDISPQPLALWTVALFMTMLVAESIWLSRALRKSA